MSDDEFEPSGDLAPTAVLTERRFTGALSIGDLTTETTFAAHAGSDGEVQIRFEPLPHSPAAAAMQQLWEKAGAKPALFRLTGTAEDGSTFESDQVLFKSFSFSWNKDGGGITWRLVPLYQQCSFRLPAEVPQSTACFRMWLKGFECFDLLEASCPLGKASAAGVAKLEDADRITGVIEITADTEPEEWATWIAGAERLAWRIRSVLTFAASVTLRAPITEVLHGCETRVTCRSQVRQVRPTMQNFPSLNLQPIFEAAVRRHFDNAPELESIGMAIEWMAQESTYNEIRLLSAVTALEHLIDTFLDDQDKLVMPNMLYSPMRQALSAALKALRNDENGAAIDELETKLGDLNRRSLRRKLDILAKRWSVPLEGIDPIRLRDAVQSRNRVVHTGDHRNASLWEPVTIMRELMVRIILTVLKFEGQYATYLDGARYVPFPPPKKTASSV